MPLSKFRIIQSLTHHSGHSILIVGRLQSGIGHISRAFQSFLETVAGAIKSAVALVIAHVLGANVLLVCAQTTNSEACGNLLGNGLPEIRIFPFLQALKISNKNGPRSSNCSLVGIIRVATENLNKKNIFLVDNKM
jgi:hypothetical protein